MSESLEQNLQNSNSSKEGMNASADNLSEFENPLWGKSAVVNLIHYGSFQYSSGQCSSL